MKRNILFVFCVTLIVLPLLAVTACSSGKPTTGVTTTAKTTVTTSTAATAKPVEKNVVYQIRNDSGKAWMLDSSAETGYYDDLDAFDASDYTVSPGETVRTGVNEAKRLASGEMVETSLTTYELLVTFAAGPLPDDPKEQYVYIEDVTLQPLKINGTYGEEPVIVWDGSAFKQVGP